ncbi:MAG TPA: choice-of-anchor Q domain-containing protein [Alphaproteobacteria bacterium]|nr:choice-of-anchor Q domain-containing protein [Alphaproteobacteria bacterium]
MKTGVIHWGITLFAIANIHTFAATLYVDANGTNPDAPYANWNTAATNIQDAVDASSGGDLVLVSNGVYQTGGRVVYDSLTNRLVINKAITVESVNGPAVTLIVGNSILGSSAIRCVFMGNNAVLAGFTVTNGGTLNSGDFFLDESGGGIWATNSDTGVIVSNCVLTGNIAEGIGGGAYDVSICTSSIVHNSAFEGGAVGYDGTFTNFPIVTNCLIANNSASAYGGGAFGAELENCIVIQNVASWGGGVEAGSGIYGCLIASNTAAQFPGGVDGFMKIQNCTIVDNMAYQGVGGVDGGGPIFNSIIYYNTVVTNGVADYNGGTAIYCCTTITGNAIGCITNEPMFVNLANGDFRLASNSPCINGGEYVGSDLGTDLDGNPRIVDGFVDMGAYEYQTPDYILPYYWAQEYGLSVNDGTVIDPDENGMNYWETAVAGLNPTNAASVLRVSVSNSVSGAVVTWPNVAYKVYDLQRSTNLLANPAFIPIYTNFPVPAGTPLIFRDNITTNGGTYFYRVGVLH